MRLAAQRAVRTAGTCAERQSHVFGKGRRAGCFGTRFVGRWNMFLATFQYFDILGNIVFQETTNLHLSMFLDCQLLEIYL